MGRIVKGFVGLCGSRNGSLAMGILVFAWQIFMVSAALCLLGKIDGTALVGIGATSGTVVGACVSTFMYTRAKFNPGESNGTF